MEVIRLGIIMNGVTGRMGANQHLARSILEIRRRGGVRLGERLIMPEPILVGRSEERLRELARAAGLDAWSTDLDAVLGDAAYPVYFDATLTQLRPANVRRAIAAGKHVYCEKPTACTVSEALDLYHAAAAAGVKNGVVQDKLWLPGMVKLRRLIEAGFFGKILALHGEFGYWVFEGPHIPPQRPSWNYKKEEGGGIILDMFCHWRYLLEHLFGPVLAVSCVGAVHIPERFDEQGQPYRCTAEDAAYATFELEGGIIAQFNCSWATRVRRDDLFTLQVDGTRGSAVAGLRACRTQHYVNTPRPVWNPDVDQPIDFFAGWQQIPDQEPYENAFLAQWQLFLRHVVDDRQPFPWTLLEGAKGVQLAEKALESWSRRAWVDLEPLAETQAVSHKE